MRRTTIVTAALLVSAAAGALVAPAEARARRSGPDVRRVEAPAEDRQAVLDGNLAFALDAWARLREEEPGNLVVSPLSLSTALAMTMAAARGETRDEMAAALRLTLPPGRLDVAFQSVLAELRPSRASRIEWNLANAFWSSRELRLRDEFRRTLATHYGARAAMLDFLRDPEGARLAINAWGSRQTRGRIPDVLPPDSITDQTALVLANAIYLRARWAEPFPSDLTQDRPFRLADGTTVAVPTMGTTATFGRASGPGLEAVELAYRGDDLAMLVLVPDAPDGLPALESQLTPENLAAWTAALVPTWTALSLPKFETHTDADLVPALKALGMTRAFVPYAADLSGAAGLPGDLYVDLVRQGAFLRVDEQGTEAAAVTVVVGGLTSAPPWIAVDRPFLYLVRHRPTGTILFMGRVTDPSAAR